MSAFGEITAISYRRHFRLRHKAYMPADMASGGRDVCLRSKADKGRIEILQRSSLLPDRVPTRAGSAQRPASIQNNSVRPHQMRQQQH